MKIKSCYCWQAKIKHTHLFFLGYITLEAIKVVFYLRKHMLESYSPKNVLVL